MKKISMAFILIILAVSLMGCGGERTTTSKGNTNTSSDNSVASVQNTSGASDTVMVPNVVGMNKDEAVKKLEGLGLIVETGYKHLQKDQQGNLYPDDEILEQSINAGTIVAPNTSISLTYNINTEAYASNVKSDGTVNLGLLLLWRPDTDEILIPEYYDGKKVSSISTSILISIDVNEQIRTRKVLIPKDVVIEDGASVEDFKLNIIRY